MSVSTQPEPPAERKTFTGLKRRTTRKSVRVIDTIAKWVITVGGLAVIGFFATIVIFLFSVVVPLFRSTRTELAVETHLPPPAAGTDAIQLAIGIDEYLKSLWTLDDKGLLSVYRTAGGELVSSQDVTDGVAVTAMSHQFGTVGIGLADGRVKVGRIGHGYSWLDQTPDALESLADGETAIHESGVAMRTPTGQIRVISTEPELSEPLDIVTENPSPVHAIDYTFSDRLEAFVVMLGDGRLYYSRVEKNKNMMTGKVRRDVEEFELPRPRPEGGPLAASVLLGLNGRQVFVLYADGGLVRFNTDNPAEAYIAEELDVLPDAGKSVSAAKLLLGDLTMIVGDSAGGVSGWFPGPFPDGQEPATRDQLHMILAHELPVSGGPVQAIANSSRDRQFVTADDAGNITLRHMTSGTNQADLKLTGGRRVRNLVLSPKTDAIVAMDDARQVSVFGVDNPHADGSMRALFFPIHYEGYSRPSHVWQSSAGTDDAEPKLSIVPMVFGTIKATFYAMLLAVPLAIAAAIYSSEFMQPRVRNVVKPVVEMMASLPSVVLGFIAALVLAPFVENVVPAVLITFVAVPLGVTAFGYIWQLLPPSFTRTVPGFVPLLTMTVLVVLGWLLSYHVLGPLAQRTMFGGDFRRWLEGNGSPIPGWALLLTPLLAVGISMIFNLYGRQHLGLYNGAVTDRLTLAFADGGRLLATGLVAAGLATAIGWVLSSVGMDLRDSVIGPYVQRNTLIVGIAMGFAIIPIIYTVSEDALSSVPSSLRSASLGAGATPWQTAIRVVLPVAISGIFSACMIGFGRAAGETMIVLMAGGNTAVLDANLFNGVRPLSANIAVEMPEAPVNSTHYRVLFLSALVLFVLTFIVNTFAEIIRARFRKKAYQL